MRYLTAILSMTAVLTGCGVGTGSAASGSSDARVATTQVQVASGARYQLEMTREESRVAAVLPAEPDAVWAELGSVYQEIGIDPGELAVYQPAEHRMGVAELRVGRLAGKRLSLLLDCGHSFGVPRADQADVRVFLTTWLSPDEDGTLVTTRFEAREGQRGSMCSSRGRLEQEILTRLLQRVM